MKKIILEKTEAEHGLANLNDVLEQRVQERTNELAILNVKLQNEIQENKKLQDELEMRVEQRTSELLGEIQERLQVERELESINKVLTASSNSEREQRKVAEGLMEAAIALNSSQTVNDVLDRILDETQRVLPSTAIALILMEKGKPKHAGWRGFDQLEQLNKTMVPDFQVGEYPVLSNIFSTNDPILVSDTSSDPAWRPVEGLEWIRSFASAPMGNEGDIIGYLQIISDRPDQFTERSLQILNGFAAHAGLAIQNARLIENLQKSLTKEREIREELIRAEKLAAMGRTIASVAHELNNPIQTIKNCTFLMRNTVKGTKVEDPSTEMLNMISTETQRISTLVSELREFFRPNLNLTMVQVNLREMILDVSETLIPQMRASKVTTVIHESDTPLVIFGVPDQVRQVFINLFQNAIDAMSEEDGGQLEVKFSLSEDRRMVAVVVADSGPGISEEVQSKVFEPFFTTKPKGIGLGLPIVFQIVDRHGGTIRINSTPGNGSSFYITLPLIMGMAGDN
jgi:C4-dicarboxylate-specific signal transduction histidine kinase